MAKSIISQRRKAGAICPVCKSPDYSLSHDPSNSENKKPTFACNSCAHRWQHGIDGGIYMQYLSTKKTCSVSIPGKEGE